MTQSGNFTKQEPDSALWLKAMKRAEDAEAEVQRLREELGETAAQLDHLRAVVMNVDVYAQAYVWRAPDGTEHTMNPADVSVYILAGAPHPQAQLPWEGNEYRGGKVRIQRNGSLIRIGDGRGSFADIHPDVAEQGALAVLRDVAKGRRS